MMRMREILRDFFMARDKLKISSKNTKDLKCAIPDQPTPKIGQEPYWHGPCESLVAAVDPVGLAGAVSVPSRGPRPSKTSIDFSRLIPVVQGSQEGTQRMLVVQVSNQLRDKKIGTGGGGVLRLSDPRPRPLVHERSPLEISL